MRIRAIYLLSIAIMGLRLSGQHNSHEIFSTQNGLANNGCSDVLIESDGTVWVGHDFYGSPTLNNKPFSRRKPNGSWDYPFNTIGFPVVTVNGANYSWGAFSVNEIYQTSNGDIWFIPNTPNATDMNNAPPLLVLGSNGFEVKHISLGNFPNQGAVHTMVQDSYGNIWFGCEDGLIKLDANSGLYSTIDPPSVSFNGAANPHTSKRVFELDYDLNDRILMLTGHVTNLTNDRALFRVYNSFGNSWSFWTHLDAPWRNANQPYYAPANILATRNAQNRVYVSSDGGGLYYIDNGQWGSDDLYQIADFVRGWAHPGFTFTNVYTNLPDFTRELYADPDNELWILGITGANTYAYKHFYTVRTEYNNDPANRYIYGYKQSPILYNNNGIMTPSRYQAMAFYQNEIWISSEHGLERWYYDELMPSGDWIAVEGVGNKKQGVAGFNTKSSAVLEPANTGHKMPTIWPDISIDTAYYYLATTDYENINPNIDAGIVGNGRYQGFNATAAALAAAGLSFNDLEFRFDAISLQSDIRNRNWTYNNGKEIRHYEEWFDISNNTVTPQSYYEILIDGDVLFRGRMPDFDLHLEYNHYGYLFDSIGGISDPSPLIPNPNITDPQAVSIQDSLLADIDGKSIRFVFRTIQTALNTSIITADRIGGVYQVFDAYLQKVNQVTPLPTIPMCGDYTIGQTQNADYASFSAAVQDLHQRGIVCDVNFHVGKGNYQEQVHIGTYEGMDQFRVSFDGNDDNPLLNFSPSHSDSNYVVEINGTQNLSFKNIAIQNNAANYGRVMHLKSSTPNFLMDDCELTGVSNAPNSPLSAKNRYILLECNDCDQLLLENNSFLNGSDGLNLRGTAMRVINNLFQGNTSVAVEMNNGNNIQVSQNMILGPSTGNFRGIQCSGYPFQIENNQILNSTANCLQGIYSSSFSQGNANTPARIVNNEISVHSTSGFGAAILVACGHVKIYHNSIKVLGNNSNFIGLQNFSTPAGWSARNNIIVNPNGVCFYTSKLDAGSSYPDADYNLYFSNHSSPFQTQFGFNAEVDHASLPAFRTASLQEANSLFLDPQFATDDHLLPMAGAASAQGQGGLGVLTDRLLRFRPALNPDQGCYEFDGVGWTGAQGTNWRNPMNWSGAKVPTRNAKVFVSPRNNNPVIDTAIEVQEFVMHHNASLRIRSNAGLRVDSLLQNSGNIVLEADTSGSYARLIQGKISGGGTIKQEGLLRAADSSIRWFHLGVPVRTKVSDLANDSAHINAGANGASIYFWDAASGQWVSPPDTSAYLEPGIGYAVAAGQNVHGHFLTRGFPGIIDVSGDLRSADSLFHIDLGYTQLPQFNSYVSQVNDGWNLLANPYHAVYDMNGQVIPGNYKTIYVWNGTSYKTFNAQLNLGDQEARYIAPLQGFFIRTDSLQAGQGFDFKPSQRVLNNSVHVQKMNWPKFSLEVRGNKQSDQCHFLLHPQAQSAFEEDWDAAKLRNDSKHLNFYSFAQNEAVSINVQSENEARQGIRLGLETSLVGEYRISLSPDADPNYTYWLYDALMDKYHRIDFEDYSFQSNPNSSIGRFTLFLVKQDIGLDHNPHSEVYWHLDGSLLNFEQLPSLESEVQVMDLSGRTLWHGKKLAGQRDWKLSSNQIPRGIYWVQFKDLDLQFKVLIP